MDFPKNSPKIPPKIGSCFTQAQAAGWRRTCRGGGFVLMSTQSRLHISAFLAAAILTGIAMTPSQADALWTRTHATHCMTFGGAPIDLAFGVQNDSNSQAMLALCPVPDDDRFPKTSIKTLNVHGYDGSTSDEASVMTCRTNAWSTAGSCSSQVTTAVSGTGNWGLTAPLVGWSSTDFAYVYVRIPAKQGSSRSTIRGYYTSN